MHLDLFETLADPTRRQIVEALVRGERAVSDIVDRVEIHQSGVSRHLGILQEAGFVRVRSDGPRRLYSLRPERFRELDKWLERYRSVWEARLDRFGAEIARRQKVRSATKKKEGP